MQKSDKKKWKKSATTLAQCALFVVLLWLIWGKLEKAWEQILSAEYELTLNWFWLTVASVVYAVSLPFPASYWFVALRHLGQKPTYLATIRAHLVGHLGKYIPGKIFVVLIRSGLLKGPGVDTTVCVLSIFLEGLMQMAVGALVVAVLIVGWSLQTGDQRVLFGSLLLLLAVGLPILPPIFKFGVKFIGVKKFSDEVKKVDQLPWRTFLFGVPLMIGYWFLLGLSLWCVLRGIGVAVTWSMLPVAMLAISASMVVGFVFVVAPGGLGVRETIIIMLLTTPLAVFTTTPEAAVAVAACMLRILWIVVELLCAGTVYAVLPGNREKEERGEEKE